MAYTLKSGDSPEDASWELLGDRRLVNEIAIMHGVAYIHDEKPGPPAKWAAESPKLGGSDGLRNAQGRTT